MMMMMITNPMMMINDYQTVLASALMINVSRPVMIISYNLLLMIMQERVVGSTRGGVTREIESRDFKVVLVVKRCSGGGGGVCFGASWGMES